MSTHAIPAGLDIDRLRPLVRKHLREPSGVAFGGGLNAAPTALEFTPDLTAGEQTTLGRIFTAAARPLDLSPSEEQAIQDERATLAAYLGNASPTAAQTTAALKSLIRVVRALIRDS